MIARRTAPAEWLRTEELFAIAFEQPMTRKDDAEPDKNLHYAAFDDDGQMMSTLQISDYTVNFDGSPCRMGGIGGVATLPQYRRRGGIRACFQVMLPEMYEMGYDFSYLYPFSTAFYRQFGYECCVQLLDARIELGLLRPKSVSTTARLAEQGNAMAGDIQTLDRLWEARYNMAVQHKDADYEWVAKLDPAVKQEFCYVLYRADGSPAAYTVFRKADQEDGRNLVCSSFVFTDRQSFSDLIQLLRTLASDHRYLKLRLPNDTAMQYLMPEWSLGAVHWELAPAGMVRVIHVPRVLELAKTVGTGRLVLEIRDDGIGENNGRWLLQFADGRSTVTPTREDADAVLDIRAFSALICGVCGIEEAAACLDGVQIMNPNAPLAALFRRKPLLIRDYF